ncbi:MAG TPA: DNA-primase RepB domain-containing protein [Novosphingobium sp.]|nr:DNA-primase RepB domain-containing protein [Novosphingobium sp.]
MPAGQDIVIPQKKSAEIIKLPTAHTPASKIDANSIVVPSKGEAGKAGAATKLTHLEAEPIDSADHGKEGKEGDNSAPFTTFPPSNRDFLAIIFAELPEGAGSVVTAKSGDPHEGGWYPHNSERIDDVCQPSKNTYFNCASLVPNDDGTIAARKESAAAYHALVLDDVGSKVDRALLASITPTWELETSPGNFQIGFRLSPPLTEATEVDRFQHRFAKAGLTDKGALGMVRWVRLPNGINGKPKYEVDGKPFACRLHAWNPETYYTANQLADDLAPVSTTSECGADSAQDRRVHYAGNNGVFFPANAENPVVTAFKARGLYKRELSAGRHDVTCPWAQEHTDALDTGAAYFEPSEEFPKGGFRCLHSHGEEYAIGKVLDHLGLSEAEGRNRPRIRVVAGELNLVVASVEQGLARHGGLYQSGGLIVSVKQDSVTGDATIRPVSESELTLAMAAACDWEKYDGRGKAWVRCDPPEKYVRMIFKAENYTHLPELRGFARQPFYRAGCTELVNDTGYDPISKRLGLFDAGKFARPATTIESAREALALLSDLLGEFHFANDVDRAAALSAILTAVIRPALDFAPAFHVTAPSPGSGKSYLCETICLFAGPGPSSKISYPRTSEEATKVILSTLLSAPAVIEFDDMDTDWLPHGAINRMLTATSISDRLLGYSKMATVGTTALVLGSGNNVGPLKDLARRVLTINLNAKSASPATLSYKGNPVLTLKGQRERYVAAVLTIIEAWKAAGSPMASVPSIASYGGAWSSFCRQPLIWLGLPDPATTLLEQVRIDPDSDTLQRLLEEWHGRFGDRPITLRKLLQDVHDTELGDALSDLPVTERGSINRSKLGWYFKKNQNRIVGGYTLRKVDSSERNTWQVEKAVDQVVPPLPPSSGPLPAVGSVVDRSAPPAAMPVEDKFD